VSRLVYGAITRERVHAVESFPVSSPTRKHNKKSSWTRPQQWFASFGRFDGVCDDRAKIPPSRKKSSNLYRDSSWSRRRPIRRRCVCRSFSVQYCSDNGDFEEKTNARGLVPFARHLLSPPPYRRQTGRDARRVLFARTPVFGGNFSTRSPNNS